MNKTTDLEPAATLVNTDLLGSPLGGLGAERKRVACYTPFGYTSTLPGGLVGFTGQLMEPVEQCYCLGHGYRTYSTTLMRFTSPDEFSPFDRGGLNSYAYCGNQPVTQSDPHGRFALGRVFAKVLRGASVTGAVGGAGAVAAGVYLGQKSEDTTLAAVLLLGGIAMGVTGFVGLVPLPIGGRARATQRSISRAASRGSPTAIEMQNLGGSRPAASAAPAQSRATPNHYIDPNDMRALWGQPANMGSNTPSRSVRRNFTRRDPNSPLPPTPPQASVRSPLPLPTIRQTSPISRNPASRRDQRRPQRVTGSLATIPEDGLL